MAVRNGALARARRRRLDLSTKEVAADVEVSEGHLRNVEAMRVKASVRLMARLAARLDLDIEDLLTAPEHEKAA